jgi:hypothetical protein
MSPMQQTAPMRFTRVLPALVALAACDPTGPLPRTPGEGLASEIEAKLSKVPCIGSMSRWERRYSYSSRPSDLAKILTFGSSGRWYKYNSVEIDYRQAGFDEFRAGRVFYRGAGPFEIDDRQYNLVLGHYNTATHTAYVWACGPNFSSDDPQHPRIVVR